MTDWKKSLPETDIKISLDDEPPEAWDRAYNRGPPEEWKEKKMPSVFNGDLAEDTASNKIDNINPSHYRTDTIECIDAIEAMLTPEEFIGFLRGTIMQYDWRYPNKNGIEDLNKSQWYRDRLISKLKEGRFP